MRFTILQLLLVFPAFAIAFFVAGLGETFIVTHVRSHLVETANNLREIDLMLYHAEEVDGAGPIPDDVLDRWLTGMLSSAEFEKWELRHEAMLDEWDRPFRIVRGKRGDEIVHVGVYSLGRDGVSRSGGNDPDDVNNWDDHHEIFYLAEMRAKERIEIAICAFWCTPLIYAGLVWLHWVGKTHLVGEKRAAGSQEFASESE